MVDYDNLSLWCDESWYDYNAKIGKPNYCRFVYDPAKTNFYKLVTEHNIPDGYNSVNIKSGTIMEYKNAEIAQAPFGLQGPFFHFSKGAFNTMLWRESLDYDWNGKIYKVQPLSPVVGNISEGKAQFGAERLMFLNKVSPKQMIKKALEEFEANCEQIKIMNPLCYDDKALPLIIKAWKKNKCSSYIY